ncbi:hypothetical protein M9H77_13762 [Catharanthus roseus]|uniref:Uncharacterized protein n=1 Tax=Catharanthus roseus TaxID=4058 RepID=A0ACC0BL90_CATRO|nr:hypothetical protein M9H77_13762 [Catharanthus roseus]
MRRSFLDVGHYLRSGVKLCKPYIQRFAMLGHKSEHKLVDLRIRLDMMIADEVKWTPYRLEEIKDVWTWTSFTVVPTSHCTDDYMAWFLSRTHPRIQSPERLPRGFQLPTATPISKDVLQDMITREVDRDDTDSDTKIRRISDMLRKYYQPRP